MTTNHADLIARLRAGADDPMWADHCEMPKRTARAAADALAEKPSVREPLSDAQICETLERERMKWSSRAGPPTYEFATAFARAIEAKHGIGVKGEA